MYPWNKGKKGLQKHSEAFKRKRSEKWKGNKNPRWNNGRERHSSGYILIHKPKHPFANKKEYVFEHRLVMEKKLRRYLTPFERVHHINGIKDDNRPKNLIYFPNESKHQKHHNTK